ncbi:MAG: DUF2207 domain-containing protein, partial [Firmicutes bacterium]|nr:DUF2207 domain-containing protein [Bacillota bacterium]
MKHFGRRLPAVLLGFILIAMMVLAVPAEVFAEDYGSSVPTRVTKYFNVDVQVNENNSYEFTETVGTVFNTEGHGIYRNVPTTFDGISEKVDSGWCATDPVEIYEENGYYVMQMGSGSSYIYGDHEFKYGYRMAFRDDRDDSGDYMYIDVLPTDWQTPIESSEITVTMPKDIEEDWTTVYIGKYGSEYDDTTDSWELEGNRTIRIKAEDLDKGVGITVLTKLPEGYWVGEDDGNGTRTTATALPAILALLLGALWTRFGRRQHIVETIEFRPPEGVTPAEIGLIIDGVLDKKDMVSMFVYFAHKGYMTIEEEKKKRFIFTKLKDIDDSEKEFAKMLFNGLFEDGDVIYTKNMGEDFAYSYRAACDTLEAQFGDVIPTSTKVLQRLSGLAMIILAVAVPIMGIGYMLRPDGYVFGSIITAFIAMFMTGRLRNSYRNRMSGKKTGSRVYRIILWAIDAAALLVTAVGVGSAFESVIVGAIYFIGFGASQFFNVYCGRLSDSAAGIMGKVLGLRTFIKTAEVDRIEALVEEDPEYFYSILPYAYVMGLTNKWIKKFENINVMAPDWYHTYNTTGTYMPIFYMNDSMSGMTSAVTTSIAPHLPAGTFSGSDIGGGFSGGGFSGGGGGFSGGG